MKGEFPNKQIFEIPQNVVILPKYFFAKIKLLKKKLKFLVQIDISIIKILAKIDILWATLHKAFA